MAAPCSSSSKKKSSCWDTPEVYKHHEQQNICISRAKYREGRRDRAVKVYTINLESRYVMVQGVPAIGVMTELVVLCALYGAVEEYRPLDEYPAEQFTEVYLVKFQKLTSARAAKRRMDGTSFYGGVLHVCYVPEYETVEDTRLKLQDRRRYVTRTAQNIAREKSEATEGDEESTASDNKTTASQRTTSAAATHDRSSDDNHTRPARSDHSTARQASSSSLHVRGQSSVHHDAGESWTSSSSSFSSRHSAGGFPLLPLPPREEHRYRRDNASTTTNPHRTTPTEDNMGTLHNAVIVDRKQQPTPEKAPASSSSSSAPAAVALVPRFVPRTQHLENRKRKMEEEAAAKKSRLMMMSSSVSSRGGTGADGEGPLVGPKLPEPPRMDMEDASLNTTVSRIRSTLQQVASVPDITPAQKKVKPRRRI